MLCVSCKETVGHGPKCSVCKGVYHFKCGSITEEGFCMLGSGRESWMCPTCRDTNNSQLLNIKPSTSSTPVTPRLSSDLPIEQSSSPLPQSQLSQDSILQEILSKVTSLQEQFIAFQTIESDLKQVKDVIADLKSTFGIRIDDISQCMSEIEQRLEPLEKAKSDMDNIKELVKNLLVDIDNLKEVVKNLSADNVRNEQWIGSRPISQHNIDEFLGKEYVMISEENFETYLIHLGMGFVKRKIAVNLRPTQCLTRNEDGTYKLTVKAPVFTWDMLFVPGVLFDGLKPDGEKLKSLITFDGNIMTHNQYDSKGINSIHVLEFTPEQVTTTTTVEGTDILAKRVYELVK